MKKIFLTSITAFTLLTGCSGFLDEDPKSGMSQEEAFKNPKLVYVNTVATVYSSFNNCLYGANENVHTLQEFTSDAWMLPGRQADWIVGTWQTIFLHNYEAGLSTSRIVWNDLYNVIGKCNTSIENLQTFIDQGGDDFLLDYQYEVRAVRAIFYYYLLDLFGRVPIVTSSNTSMDEVKQSERSELYNFVMNELLECIPHLASGKCQNAGTYYGRITKAVGYMAIAKMAINSPIFTKDNWIDGSFTGGIEKVAPVVTETGKTIRITLDGETRNAWETVIYCQQQIEKEGYMLQPNFAGNFSKTNNASIENIWIQPSDGSTYLVEDRNIIRTLHYQHGDAVGLQGWNGTSSTLQQMRIFGYGTGNPDPRLNMTFFYGEVLVNGNPVPSGLGDGRNVVYNPLSVVVDFDNTVDDYTVKMSGARLAKYEIDNTTSAIQYSNVDKVFWRYADVLLMAAEAKVRMGQSGDAEVNLVRSRVGAEAKSNITLQDILDERLLELSYEGLRRQDQVRFGTYTEPTADRYAGVWHNIATGDYVVDKTGYTTVFPIPQTVLELNTQLTQNKGY